MQRESDQKMRTFAIPPGRPAHAAEPREEREDHFLETRTMEERKRWRDDAFWTR